MDRQVDSLFSELNKFSTNVETILNHYHAHATQLQARSDNRNRSKNTRVESSLNASPGLSSQSPFMGGGATTKDQEKKLNELMKNNDHIY